MEEPDRRSGDDREADVAAGVRTTAAVTARVRIPCRAVRP